ncbi:uncharacterized protein LOC127718824 [Mytilus californianus]|uniref:uncharacterized protein LOC127718824 n=1 Tax=Mytilus californianus TaxID=6549 RepID=UPI0022470E7C|nr:uncharacterized protein LOC127718824 [Mytilus californianus]
MEHLSVAKAICMYLLKNLSPRVVRANFDRYFSPTNLLSTLTAKYNTLLDLKSKGILNQTRRHILVPRNGVADSKTFDVALMICLIKNLTTIIPVINGFYREPQAITLQNIRFKLLRDTPTRHATTIVDLGYLNTTCRYISDIKLGTALWYILSYKLTAIKAIKHTSEEISKCKETTDVDFRYQLQKADYLTRDLAVIICRVKRGMKEKISERKETIDDEYRYQQFKKELQQYCKKGL